MTLIINGQMRTLEALDAGSTVGDLLSLLAMQADRVALERNGEIVSRSAWPVTSLSEGDRLEIVHFVGGGTGEPSAGHSGAGKGEQPEEQEPERAHRVPEPGDTVHQDLALLDAAEPV